MIQNLKIEVKEMNGKEYVTKLAYDELKGEAVFLLNEHTQLKRNGAISDDEVNEIKRIRQEHLQMKSDQDAITVYLRGRAVLRKMFNYIKRRAEQEAQKG